MDTIIVGIIVLLALVFLVRKMIKSSKGGGCGCGCGGSCSTSKKSASGKLPPCCCGKPQTKPEEKK